MRIVKAVQLIAIVFLSPLVVSIGLVAFLVFISPSMPNVPPGPYPGDTIIPDAVMIYDNTRMISAAPSDVWPWYVVSFKPELDWL